ncbi:MAG: GTP pyrophosphokinase family protein [Ruminococcaceae bacterium]|nr:GTP pyrophosphokinase family protein [Oscillospiraceae bacterium]
MNGNSNFFYDSIGIDQNRLVSLDDVAANMMYDHSKRVIGSMIEYKELIMMYTCAMKEIKTKFEVLDTDFRVRYSSNPISSICTRIKSTASIAKKMHRLQVPMSAEGIVENINDVAGVRVICSYIDDIYLLADALLKQTDVKLITKKDYIANPKSNGYRSLHLIVTVPVFFMDEKRDMKVEVQIRTIAMDFWASLEHQLKYKQEIENQQQIVMQLKECADVIAATDERMLGIREQIGQMQDTPSEEDIMLEKLGKFDINLG